MADGESAIWYDAGFENNKEEFEELKSDVVQEIATSNFKSFREMIETDDAFA